MRYNESIHKLGLEFSMRLQSSDYETLVLMKTAVNSAQISRRIHNSEGHVRLVNGMQKLYEAELLRVKLNIKIIPMPSSNQRYLRLANQ